MKIISYNTQHWRNSDRVNSLEKVLALKADFYTMQEVDENVKASIHKTLDINQYSIHSGKHSSYPDKESKTIIIYNTKFELVNSIQHPFYPETRKNSLGTTIWVFKEKENWNIIQVASTHQIAQHLPYKRREQTLQTLSLIDHELPCILAWDFNTGFSFEVKKLTSILNWHWMQHLTANIWWTCDWERLENNKLNLIPKLIGKKFKYSAPLDHVSTNEKFNRFYSLINIQVLRQIKWSDHLPVLAEFNKWN